MRYDVSFGSLEAPARAAPGAAFRLALLGDFSGRASKGTLETGAGLAARKPLLVDVDNLDAVLARLAPRIVVPLGPDGETIEVPIAAIDDFHPDQLVEALPLFEQLLTLRRNLQSKAGYARAAKEVLSWAGAEPLPARKTRRARGGAIATDRTLSDFARLTGRPSAAEASTEELIRRLVGPSIVAATDGRQDALIARVDAALSDAMRRVLHHPEFQSAEALWRGVEMLVRRLETGAKLRIVLFDISAEELAADLASSDDLEDTALYSLLIEQPAADAGAGAFSMIAGLYTFELSPPHADLLGRMARLASGAGAPCVSAIGPDALLVPDHEWHELIQSAWTALRELPEAEYLGLTTPRFLLRMPYGKRTDPIDAFAFEEFTREGGLSAMLWGNPTLLLAQCVAQTWLLGGKAMKLGAINVVGDLPVYVYRDADGDQVALPCTERLFTERLARRVESVGVIPVVSLRGRPEVRVAGVASVGGPQLAGRWPPMDTSVPVHPEPEAPAAEAEPADAEADAPADDTPAADDAPADDAPADDAEAGTPAETTAAEDSAPAEASDTELDGLLAGLSTETPAAEAGETEPDLDALLASLK